MKTVGRWFPKVTCIMALAAVCCASFAPICANAESSGRVSDKMLVIPMEQQEQMFYEGDVKLDEEITVKLPPLKLLPSVVVRAESIRFYAKNRYLRATMQFLADEVPDGLYVLGRLDLLGDRGQCYATERFAVPRLAAATADAGQSRRRTIDRQLYGLQLTKDVVRRFRISLHAVRVSSEGGIAEGTMALGVRIPVNLERDLPDFPNAVKCWTIRFENMSELAAWLMVTVPGEHDSKWAADLEVLDKDGARLSHARRVFSSGGGLMPQQAPLVGRELCFALGRWIKVARSIQFRLSLNRVHDDAWESFEAPFEIGSYSLMWLTAGAPPIPHNLVMLRGVQFNRLDNGNVQASLRAGGIQVVDTEWQIRLELLDADSHVLHSVVTTLVTKKEREYHPHGSTIYVPSESDISLDLGREQDVSKATRFRISLRRSADRDLD